MEGNTFWGPLAALLTSVTWVSGSYAYTQLSLRYHPIVINVNRAMVGLFFFALATLYSFGDIQVILATKSVGFVLSRVFWLSLSVLSSYGLGDMLFFWSALALGFPTAQAIGALYPLWAALGGIIILGETPTFINGMGMGLAIGGIILILLQGKEKEQALTSPSPPSQTYKMGLIYAFVTSFAWAVNSFATHQGGSGFPVALGNLIRMSMAFLICIVISRFVLGRKARLFFSWEDYRKYLPIIIFEAVCGSFLYLYGMSHSPISVAATLTSLAPVFAIPIGIFLGKEEFSLVKTGAIILVVIGGIFLVS